MDTVKRELFEETKLKLTGIIKYLGYFDYAAASNPEVRQWNFLAAVTGDKIQLSPQEHDSCRIITDCSQLSNGLLISKESCDIVENALNFIKPAESCE